MFQSSDRRMPLRFVLLCFLMLTGLPACTQQVPISADRGDFAVKRIPANVGFFISADTAGYVHKENVMGDTFVFPLGEASVPRLESAFEAVFQSARPVKSLPPFEAESYRPAAVIEPRIYSFVTSIPALKTQTYSSEIAYEFTLHDPEGRVIATWLVEGYGAQSGKFGFEFARWPGEAAALALDDAMEKFVYGLPEVPEIKRWRESLGVQQTSMLSTPAAIESIRLGDFR